MEVHLTDALHNRSAGGRLGIDWIPGFSSEIQQMVARPVTGR
jgi:hypothetical protein